MKKIFIAFGLLSSFQIHAEVTFEGKIDVKALRFIQENPCVEQTDVKIGTPTVQTYDKELHDVCYTHLSGSIVKTDWNSKDQPTLFKECIEQQQKGLELISIPGLGYYWIDEIKRKVVLPPVSKKLTDASSDELGCIQKQMDVLKQIVVDEEIKNFLHAAKVNKIELKHVTYQSIVPAEQRTYGFQILSNPVLTLTSALDEKGMCHVSTAQDIQMKLHEMKEEINQRYFFSTQNLAATLGDLEDIVNGATRAPAASVCERISDVIIKDVPSSGLKKSSIKASASKQ